MVLHRPVETTQITGQVPGERPTLDPLERPWSARGDSDISPVSSHYPSF